MSRNPWVSKTHICIPTNPEQLDLYYKYRPYPLPKDLQPGEVVKITTQYTFSPNTKRCARLIERTQYGTWLIEWTHKPGSRDYMCETEYYKVTRVK